jgi:hypothetical protein
MDSRGGVSPRLTFPDGAGRYVAAVPSEARDMGRSHTLSLVRRGDEPYGRCLFRVFMR